MRREQLTRSGSGLPAIGAEFKGGYLAGVIDTTSQSGGLRYALIVSSRINETFNKSWSGSSGVTINGTLTRWNGYQATDALFQGLNGSQLAQHTRQMTYPSDGASSWYIPALDELELLYRNFKPTNNGNSYNSGISTNYPSGTVFPGDNPSSSPVGSRYSSSFPTRTHLPLFIDGGNQSLNTSYAYWTSTHASSSAAWGMQMQNGQLDLITKTTGGNIRLRPVRRFLF